MPGPATSTGSGASPRSSTPPASAPASPDPAEIARLLPHLTPAEQAELDRLLDDGKLWHPLAGPQTRAYHSEADEVFYGGSAGGGKSDLLIGLGTTAHRRSIIFRREFPQLESLVERSREIIGMRGRYNEQRKLWRLDDGRLLEFGAVQYEQSKSKYQGRPHDLKAFDELPNFLESQYRFLIGWNRTTRRGQRSRVVAAGNPPTNADGEWVIRRWGAWLDGQHADPALPGELRWYAMVDGEEIACEDGTPFAHKGEEIVPKSRTFIPARLADNPFLLASGYGATLQALPEPLRSQMLYGDFGAGTEDDPYQVIPTAWIRLAQARWRPDGRPRDQGGNPIPLTCLGVDVARGGKDKTALARRYDAWFAPVETYPGKSTPDGEVAAQLVVAALLEGGSANIDATGVGASVYDICRLKQARVASILFSSKAPARDQTGQLAFVNMRAYLYWSMREALDPQHGDDIALPPDPEILADLCAPRWTMRTHGIQIEDKAELIARLGRSPDKGDAIVLSRLPSLLPFAGEGWE